MSNLLVYLQQRMKLGRMILDNDFSSTFDFC